MADLATLGALLGRAHPSAARVAAELGPVACPTLRARLTDASDEVRELAVTSLAAIGDPADVAAYLKKLDDPSPFVRTAAARALARRHASVPDAGPALAAALGSGRPGAVRRELARALGTRDDAPLDALRAALDAEKEPEARAAIVGALVRRGDRAARAELSNGLFGARGLERMPWIDAAEYVGEAWVLPVLGSVLGATDRLPPIESGTKEGSATERTGPLAADLAAAAILRIAGEAPARAKLPLDDQARARARELASEPRAR